MPKTERNDDLFEAERRAEVTALAQRMFGRNPKRVAFPGGRTRAAFIADMGEEAPWVFAKRENREDAVQEAVVLKVLGETPYAPQLKGTLNEWVVQSCLPGTRVPLVMDELSSEEERKALIARSLDGLLHIHKAAQAANLHHRMPKIGTARDWLWNRTGAAKRISKAAGIDAPQIDRDWLRKRMDVKRAHFVKWDARPGNAIHHEGLVSWFDWEDCGRSTPLDDLAFVLFDEWTMLKTASTRDLIKTYLPHFNVSLGEEEGALYLHLFAMTHTVLRLRMALKLYHRENEWWDRAYCLAGDKVGVTASESARLIERARWLSKAVPQLEPYGPWLDAVEERYSLKDAAGRAAKAAA